VAEGARLESVPSLERSFLPAIPYNQQLTRGVNPSQILAREPFLYNFCVTRLLGGDDPLGRFPLHRGA
jgi:hypothetical protein